MNDPDHIHRHQEPAEQHHLGDEEDVHAEQVGLVLLLCLRVRAVDGGKVTHGSSGP